MSWWLKILEDVTKPFSEIILKMGKKGENKKLNKCVWVRARAPHICWKEEFNNSREDRKREKLDSPSDILSIVH